MAVYGDGGATYADLFGGGTKTYGDFGAATVPDVAPGRGGGQIHAWSTPKHPTPGQVLENDDEEVLATAYA